MIICVFRCADFIVNYNMNSGTNNTCYAARPELLRHSIMRATVPTVFGITIIYFQGASSNSYCTLV